jgi:hypothetical protein
MSTRHRYVNTLRGILREFGVSIALGVNAAKAQIGGALAEKQSEIPDGLRPILAQMLAEIRSLEEKILSIERELTVLSRSDERVQQMREIPGIGLLTSTAIRATVGEIQRFPSGRHFASWLGLTARECSSAEHRRLGGISAETCTCECSSCTARAPHCWLRVEHNVQAGPWIASGNGHWTAKGNAVITRRPSHWPIASLASSGPLGNTNDLSTAIGRARRPDPLPQRCSNDLDHEQRIGPRRGKADNQRGPFRPSKRLAPRLRIS